MSVPQPDPQTGPSAAPNPPPDADGALRGLSRRQKMAIVMGALFVVLVSLVAAGYVMWSALSATQLNEADLKAIAAMSGVDGSSLEKSVLRAYAIEAAINIKLVANKQAMILVAFSGAFALAAVGFALFLIGADGAFNLEHGAGASRLLLTGTAPGLLCFFLAAMLILVGITHRSQISLGGVSLPGASPAVAAPADRTCTDAAQNDCMDKSKYKDLAPVGYGAGA